jgi:hypothetical protein
VNDVTVAAAVFRKSWICSMVEVSLNPCPMLKRTTNALFVAPALYWMIVIAVETTIALWLIV